VKRRGQVDRVRPVFRALMCRCGFDMLGEGGILGILCLDAERSCMTEDFVCRASLNAEDPEDASMPDLSHTSSLYTLAFYIVRCLIYWLFHILAVFTTTSFHQQRTLPYTTTLPYGKGSFTFRLFHVLENVPCIPTVSFRTGSLVCRDFLLPYTWSRFEQWLFFW